MNLFIAILAGGSGTRFWPASTRAVPKQLLPLSGGKALLRETYERVAPLAPPERIAIVTSARFVDDVRVLVPEIPAANAIGEPSAKNTAAACAVAAQWAKAQDPDAVLLTLPADHVASPAEAMREMLRAAAAHAASARSLVTLGLRPTFAATGFGWIRLGDEIAREAGHPVHRVGSFVEKPDRARAEVYLAQGGHLWNLGMFAWRADVFLAEVARLLPDVATRSALALTSIECAYDGMKSISVDHGVLEHASVVDCLPCSFEWDDLGSFAALPRHLPKDAAGNCATGPLVAIDAKDCVAWAEDGRITALLGVEDLIVVHANGATLVAHRSRSEDVKKLVEELSKKGLEPIRMSEPGRALGVDYGTKRVGIAVSDGLGIAATAIEVIEETDPGIVARRVAAIAKDRGVKTLVVGIPVNMDGTEHASHAKVTAFAEMCGRMSGLPVEYVDERLTTRQAERHLWAAGLAQKGRKARVDKVAAALLLQAWLDARPR